MSESQRQMEQAARELAFKLYLDQPHYRWHGGKRSISALYQDWVNHARANPDDVEWIPTRNRNLLFKWAEEDDWERRAEQYDIEQTEQAQRRAESHRRWAVNQLSAHIAEAINALVQQINDPKTPAAARNKSIEILLDRVGVIDQSKLPVAKRPDNDTDKDNSKTGESPSPGSIRNMNDDELMDILTQKRNENK